MYQQTCAHKIKYNIVDFFTLINSRNMVSLWSKWKHIAICQLQGRVIELQCPFVHSRAITHWGRVTHICVFNLTIIGSDNGLSPGRRQAIIWTNAGILLIGPWGTNFSDILIGIQTFSFKKMHLIMLFAKWRPFCLGLNVLSKLWKYIP